MKRVLAFLLAVGMLATTSVQMAFAGDTVEIGETYVVGNFVDKDGVPVDLSVSNDYYRVSPRYLGNTGAYVEKVYIDDSDNCVHMKIKSAISLTEAKSIKVTITVTDIGSKAKYTSTFVEGDLEVNPPADMLMEEGNDKEFTLPSGYNNGRVKFVTDDKKKIGTLYATLKDPDNYETVGYYQVRVVEESPKFMHHNYEYNTAVGKKYTEANLKFITWPAVPTFATTGTLGIVMDSDQYLYQVNTGNNTLSAVTGKYNKDRETFDFSTKTLGSYAISDRKLSVGAAAAPSSSVAPAPSSTKPAAPVASSTKPTPPVASSTKPVTPPASSATSSSAEIVPESSSVESEVPESSEPESVEPESSEPDSSSTAAEPDEDEGGFPLVPVVIGVGVVLLGGVAAYLLISKKNKSSKNYDSWDD